MPRTRTATRAAASLLVAVLVALVAAGCGGGRDPAPTAPAPQPRGPAEPGTVRVGSGDDAESRLLAEIYAQGLRIRGVSVERAAATGGRATDLPALEAREVDLVPAYTGDLLHALDPAATATEPAEVSARVRAALPPTVTLLRPAAAQSSDAVVVTRDFAERSGVASLADLAPLCPRLVLGGPPGFAERAQGLPALARTYGCTVGGFRALAGGGPSTVAALREGRVQAATLLATDPAIPRHDLVVLTDPRAAFPARAVVPLLATPTASDPRVTDVLDRISAQLDTAVLTDLNRQLAAPDRPDAAEVARAWLASAGVG